MTLGAAWPINSKIKHGNIFKHKNSWKVLKIFAKKCSNDDIGLTLAFYGKIEFAYQVFIWEDLMDLVEDFSAKRN